MLTTAAVSAVLTAAGVDYVEEDDALRLVHLGANDPLRLVATTWADEDGALLVRVATAPHIPDRERDLATGLLKDSAFAPYEHELRRHSDGRSAVHLVGRREAVEDAAVPAVVYQVFEEEREALRYLDRSRVVLRPEASDLAEAVRLRDASRVDEAARLYDVGRLEEAIAALRRALAHRRPGPMDRATAMALVMLGELLFEVDEPAEGAERLAEGVPALAAAGDPAMAGHAELMAGQAQVRARDAEAALGHAERALEAFGGVGASTDHAHAAGLRGWALLALSRRSEALSVLVPLEKEVAEPTWPNPGPILGHLRVMIAIALADLRQDDEAEAYLDRAEAAYLAADDPNGAARCRAMRSSGFLRSADQPEGAYEAGHSDLFDWLTHPPRTPGGGGYVPTPGPVDDATLFELRQQLDSLRAPGGEIGLPGMLGLVDGVMPWLDGAFGGPATDALHDLADCLRRMAGTLSEAEQPGAAFRMLAELEDAHALSLRALRLFGAPAEFRSVADREGWASQHAATLVLAFVTAAATGRPRVAHALLDQALAQGLPDLDATRSRPPSPVPPRSPAPTVPDARNPADRGLAAIRAARGDIAVQPPTPEPWGPQTRAVGGPSAWRWTLWRTSGAVLWTLRTPSGGSHAGVLPLRLGPVPEFLLADEALRDIAANPLGDALDRLAQAMEPDDEGLDGSPLFADIDDTEPTLAFDLGRALLPPPLADEIRRRIEMADADKQSAGEHADDVEGNAGASPLRLVVSASAGLAHLPFALLAVTPSTEAAPLGRRLVEGAVVTLASPAPLVVAVTSRPAAPPPLPVRVAVVDPVGDLPHGAAATERHPGVAAKGVIRFREPGTSRDTAELPAVYDEVVAALRSRPEHEPGVLVWLGHASSPDQYEPLGASLGLADADQRALTARDLLLGGLHVPSRAVLYGCSTLGAARSDHSRQQGHRTSEWWGLPVATLFAGASAVVATTLRPIDCPGGAEVAAALITVAQSAPDLAEGVRQLQVDCLQAWRRQQAGDGRAFRFEPGERHPYLWAGLAVVGSYRG